MTSAEYMTGKQEHPEISAEVPTKVIVKALDIASRIHCGSSSNEDEAAQVGLLANMILAGLFRPETPEHA